MKPAAVEGGPALATPRVVIGRGRRARGVGCRKGCRRQLDGQRGDRQVQGSGSELLQAGRAKLDGLEEAQELVAIDDGQTAIHAVVEGETATGQVEARRQGR